MPPTQEIAPASNDGHDTNIQAQYRSENIVINIARAVFALGSFVLKAVAFDQYQQEPLQLKTRVVGAAFFCILSIIPLRQPNFHGGKGKHDGPPSTTDFRSTAGRQLISSRKSRILTLYLILWWYACRAVPSIQIRVAASPSANHAYNRILEKLSEIFCDDDADERQREIDVIVEQRIEEERLRFQSIQSRVVGEEKSARLSAEAELRSVKKDMDVISNELAKERNRTCTYNDNERDVIDSQVEETKRKMDTMRLEHEEKENATESMIIEMKTEIASLVEARNELQRQALMAKEKNGEELARARDEEIKTREILKQTKAEQAILEKTLHDAKTLIKTLKEENWAIQSEAEDSTRKLKATQDELAAEIQLRIQEEEQRMQAEEREALADNDAREKSQMLEDAIAEREACIAARARRGLFKRHGKKDSTRTPERKNTNVHVQSALVEIWTTSDWLFALF